MATTGKVGRSPKVIMVFLDGTRNKPSDARIQRDTNVWKLYAAASQDHNGKVAHAKYIRGVGTVPDERVEAQVDDLRKHAVKAWKKPSGTLRRGLQYLLNAPQRLGLGYCASAVGWGVSDRIREAYGFISRHYEPGDHVYLFGFSRGAFEARSLAGFIAEVGLLLKHLAQGPDAQRWVDLAYALYVRQAEAVAGSPFHRRRTARLLHNVLRKMSARHPVSRDLPPLNMHFVGAWDTVDAVVLDSVPRLSVNPRELRLTSRSKSRSHHLAAKLPSQVSHARHAIAIHELREAFEPLLMIPATARQDVRQVWFAGAHADIGGGYPGPEEAVLSNIALQWMADEARDASRQGPSSLHCDFVGIPWYGPYFTPLLPHYTTQGDFGWATPKVRKDWAGLEDLPPEIKASLILHPTAFNRLIDGASTTYESYPYAKDYAWTKLLPGGAKYPTRVVEQLAIADDQSVRLHGWIIEIPASGSGIGPVKGIHHWDITSVAKAHAAVQALIDGDLLTASGEPDSKKVQAGVIAACLFDRKIDAKAMGQGIMRAWTKQLERSPDIATRESAWDRLSAPWLQALELLTLSHHDIVSSAAQAVLLHLKLDLELLKGRAN